LQIACSSSSSGSSSSQLRACTIGPLQLAHLLPPILLLLLLPLHQTASSAWKA
jgi:hypothetical protein